MPRATRSKIDNKRDGKRGEKKEGRMRRIKKKVCQFCAEKIKSVDYKDTNRLKKFMSERGKILPSRITGNCSKHQRITTLSIKRARAIALLPYTV